MAPEPAPVGPALSDFPIGKLPVVSSLRPWEGSLFTAQYGRGWQACLGLPHRPLPPLPQPQGGTFHSSDVSH